MTEQEVIIEEAQPSDAKALLDLLNQVSKETDFIVFEQNLSLADLELFLRTRLQVLTEICLLVRVGADLAGVLTIMSRSLQPMSFVGDVFIALQEKYWGYGLGSLLMEVALDWAKQTPVIDCLELTVQARNSRAIKLYKKFGFIIDATRKGSVQTKDGEYLDVHLMHWAVK